MDKMPAGGVVTVLLDEGEPVESVSASIGEEGHEIMESAVQDGGHYRVLIRKNG
jgi:TusA-related sulfurtransferase